VSEAYEIVDRVCSAVVCIVCMVLMYWMFGRKLEGE
jgi:hypothetical protein